MIKSMTGFGRSEVYQSGYQISCEIKGVNHRYFDVYLRLPRRYNLIEDRIKELLKKNVDRGRLEVNINIDKSSETARSIVVDKELGMAYYKSLKDLADKLEISSEIRVMDIYRLPDVYNLQDYEEDLELLWEVLKSTIEKALDSLVQMRVEEGSNLAKDILSKNSSIIKVVELIEQRAPIVLEDFREKLTNRIKDLVPQEAIDEYRIVQEAAIFADKINVNEEIVRLKSHAKQFNDLMATGGSIGRKCDFIIQEMFREINTISSKANDFEMSKLVVEVKSELEKIREQLQNIE